MSIAAQRDLSAQLDRLLDETNGGTNLDPVYQELGKDEVLDVDTADIKELVHAGRIWWKRHESKFRSMVCNQPPIRSIADGKLKDVARRSVRAWKASHGGTDRRQVRALRVVPGRMG